MAKNASYAAVALVLVFAILGSILAAYVMPLLPRN